LLATPEVLAPLAADLLAMAKSVKSPVSDALERVVVGASGTSGAAAWARELGLEVPESDAWDLEIAFRPLGPKKTYEHSGNITLYGNQPEDWSVRIFIHGGGLSLKFAGDPAEDKAGLGPLESLGDAGAWIRAAEKKYGFA